MPASYTTKDFTILKFFEEINDLTRYSLIEFYKVFVLLILYKNK